MYRLCVARQFSSAHNLRNYEGKCEKLHGHNYRVELVLEGEVLNPVGLLMDFKEVKSLLDPVLEELDHSYLNDHPFFREANPSAENIARFIHEKISPDLPQGIRAAEVRIWESDGCCACFVAS